MSKGKKIYFGILLLITFLTSTAFFSYAYFTNIIEEHGKLNIVAGTLDYKIEGEDLKNNQIEITANTSRNITLTVTSLNDISSKYELYYNVKDNLEKVVVGYDAGTTDNPKGIIDGKQSKKIDIIIKNNSDSKAVITFGVHGGLPNLAFDSISGIGNILNEIKISNVTLAYNYEGSKESPTSFPTKNSGYYVDSVNCTNAEGTWDNSNWELKVKNITGLNATCTLTFKDGYTDLILNGADPVLTDNLLPVLIADDGTVTLAATSNDWYSYENQRWANAVVLKDKAITYSAGDTIPETNIESYFVWIPRYKYKIFDEGSYTGLTSIGNSAKTIEIVFETKDVTPSTGTAVDTYLTHPAFTAFNTNGIWVGKFETGYNGATSTSAAEVNSNDSSKIIIKSNVYSWRSVTVGNMFKASYDYLRTEESHMMKNTEWGAVSYLSHSKYGTCTGSECSEVRINNNSSYITGYAGTEAPTKGYNGGESTEGNRVEGTALATDGTYTVNYLNSSSNVASTTGNKTGVYDMSGGAWEYVMGYTTGASTVGGSSGITSIYSDFYTNSNWDKYYDEYSSTSNTNYSNRILGDATGEMGPFGSQVDPDNNTRYKSSWYGDCAYFVGSSDPWFNRGGRWNNGSNAGAFAFSFDAGGAFSAVGFRVVLAP